MTSSRFALNQRPAVAQPLDKPYRFIPLTQGQLAIVDVEDFERINKHPWFAMWHPDTKTFRAARSIKKKNSYMHKEIMHSYDADVDHKNHDELDNRKSNLRKCTTSQNGCNGKPRKGRHFKGTYRHRNKWQARIKISGKQFFLGSYLSEEVAARAYDQKAKELHGEFAYLNFPQDAPP